MHRGCSAGLAHCSNLCLSVEILPSHTFCHDCCFYYWGLISSVYISLLTRLLLSFEKVWPEKIWESFYLSACFFLYFPNFLFVGKVHNKTAIISKWVVVTLSHLLCLLGTSATAPSLPSCPCSPSRRAPEKVGEDLLQGKGRRWQSVSWFGQDEIPNVSKAEKRWCRARGRLASNLRILFTFRERELAASLATSIPSETDVVFPLTPYFGVI